MFGSTFESGDVKSPIETVAQHLGVSIYMEVDFLVSNKGLMLTLKARNIAEMLGFDEPFNFREGRTEVSLVKEDLPNLDSSFLLERKEISPSMREDISVLDDGWRATKDGLRCLLQLNSKTVKVFGGRSKDRVAILA